MHYTSSINESAFQTPRRFVDYSKGYNRHKNVDGSAGSVHMSAYLNQLTSESFIGSHIHEYEEVFYAIEDQVVCSMDGRDLKFGPGDYGVIRTGTAHAWRNIEDEPIRWLEMDAPQPKSAGPHEDTYFKGGSLDFSAGELPELDDPSNSHLGHYGLNQIPPPGEGRVESGGLKGVLFQMMVDESLGANHSRLFLIEHQPGVSIGLHDHPFVEAYLILEGEVEAAADNQNYVLRAGDVFWTGVGCVHAFANTSDAPVIWLETQPPMPPAENGFRFMADWVNRSQEFQYIN